MTLSRATLDAAALYELTACQFQAVIMAASGDTLDTLYSYYQEIRRDSAKAAVSRAIAFKRCCAIRDEQAARIAHAAAIVAGFAASGFILVETVTITVTE